MWPFKRKRRPMQPDSGESRNDEKPDRLIGNAAWRPRYLDERNFPGAITGGLLPHQPASLTMWGYMDGRASGILTFGVQGGFEAGVKFYDALELFKRLVNIGDAKSLACHPASTTHRQLTEEEQRSVGVLPEMIRLSIGIEHIDDIVADLDQALDCV